MMSAGGNRALKVAAQLILVRSRAVFDYLTRPLNIALAAKIGYAVFRDDDIDVVLADILVRHPPLPVDTIIMTESPALAAKLAPPPSPLTILEPDIWLEFTLP